MFLYVGTYTEPGMGYANGIALLESGPSPAAFAPVRATTRTANPSFLALSRDKSRLYAVNELENGRITAFSCDPISGELRRSNSQPTGGAHPCYLSLDASERFLLVVNYTGGSVAVFPIAADGTLSPASQLLSHTGMSVDPVRQQAPHPHMIAPSPDGRLVYVTDLGTDQVVRYRLDTDAGTLVDPLFTDMAPGMGPRHFAFSPDGKSMIVIGELDSTLVSFVVGDDGELTPVSSVSTLPNDFTGKSMCAHVAFSPDGRFVYGSNRGHDSIAVAAFDAETRGLKIVEIVPTGGKEPRNFALDPSGRWLLAANQNSDSITIFARDEATGKLTSTGSLIATPTPVCLLFAEEK